MEMLSKKQRILIIIGITAIILFVGYYYINSTKDLYNYEEFETSEDIEEGENTEKEETEETIIVHVAGAVVNQGIVKIKKNSRIDDVIKAAGGTTEEADLNNVNLAYTVEDGQKIYIPSKSEIIQNSEKLETVTEGPGSANMEEGDNEKDIGLININTANKAKLQELPGIGEATALKIIDYREENGKFKTIEDIKNVSGIGDSKYESIKDLICV